MSIRVITNPLFVLCTIGVLAGQTSYNQTVMAYNILDYQGNNSDDDSREDDLRMIVQYVSPDILMAEEVHGTTGFNHFLDDVLNYDQAGLYAGAFVDQPTTDVDIALFYKADILEVISTTTIDVTSNWGNRDALQCVMRHLETDIEFRLYGVHLKAGTGSSNEQERESEASNLRAYLNTLEATSHFLVLGDFNFYHSGEGGFQRLTESQDDNDGRVFDPINRIGYWHTNPSFADVHTQSPRAYYQGQNYGGMDDRFDFILASAATLDSTEMNYVNDTYTALGNDGEHYNQAINAGGNYVVPDSVADALVAASDHIPVYLELQFTGAAESSYNVVINEIMQNPSAVSDANGEWFEIYNADTGAIDLRGWTIRDNGTDNHAITGTEPIVIGPGEFAVLARNGDSQSNGGVEALYDYSGFYLTNGADQIIILDSTGAEVDRVEYDDGATFPDPVGASMALIDATSDNNVGSNWAESTVPFGDGDLGTPGEANYDVSAQEEPVIPKRFELYQNYPNPFNATTTITFALPRAAEVRLVIYDLLGREVVTLLSGRVEEGRHTVVWDTSREAVAVSGVYLCRLETEEYSETEKLLLLK